jgi:hypothetical protein
MIHEKPEVKNLLTYSIKQKTFSQKINVGKLDIHEFYAKVGKRNCL